MVGACGVDGLQLTSGGLLACGAVEEFTAGESERFSVSKIQIRLIRATDEPHIHTDVSQDKPVFQVLRSAAWSSCLIKEAKSHVHCA